MKVLYFVRHGEAEDDVFNLFGGAADHEPTEQGLSEAKEFAKSFQDKVDLIVTSPYQRARKPAAIVAKIWKIPLLIEADLRERNQYGILTGMNRDEAAQKYPELVEALKKPASQVPGAELNELFRKRVREVADKIWDRPEQKILIFTHKGPMLAILDLHFGDFEADHFGWLKLTKKAGGWNLLASDKINFHKNHSH